MSRMTAFSLALAVSMCVLSASSSGQDVPFRRVLIDPEPKCDAKAIGDIDGDIDFVGANFQGPPVLLWENLSASPRPRDE